MNVVAVHAEHVIKFHKVINRYLSRFVVGFNLITIKNGFDVIVRFLSCLPWALNNNKIRMLEQPYCSNNFAIFVIHSLNPAESTKNFAWWFCLMMRSSNTASAMGLLQVLPKHTKRILIILESLIVCTIFMSSDFVQLRNSFTENIFSMKNLFKYFWNWKWKTEVDNLRNKIMIIINILKLFSK